MDSNQFTQQLVEYSQVEQQIDTNTNLQTLITQGTSNAGRRRHRLSGQERLGHQRQRLADRRRGDLDLQSGRHRRHHPAHRHQLQRHRRLYRRRRTTAGNNSFNWNGQDNNGNQLTDGTYKLTVTATDASRHRHHHLGRQRRHRQPDRHDRRHAHAGHRKHGSQPGDIAAVSELNLKF